MSPLKTVFEAARNGHLEVVRLLIEKGANVHVRTTGGILDMFRYKIFDKLKSTFVKIPCALVEKVVGKS